MSECARHRFWKRRHLTLTGASTLTRMKNGLCSNISTTCSSHMSVVTQRSCHLLVTKSSKPSMSAKACIGSVSGDPGKRMSAALFSTAGAELVRARDIRWNACFLTRQLATECLPAQMPVANVSDELSHQQRDHEKNTSAEAHQHYPRQTRWQSRSFLFPWPRVRRVALGRTRDRIARQAPPSV